MAQQEYNVTSESAPHACGRCRTAKRKCTKELPTCNLCLRLGKTCNYNESPASSTSDDVSTLVHRINELEAKLNSRSPKERTAFIPDANAAQVYSNGQSNFGRVTSDFPTMFFLDSDIFQEARLIVPRPTVTVPDEIWTLLGNMDDVLSTAAKYFATIHIWLPCVSKKRMELILGSPEPDIKADLALLLLTMKMMTDSASNFADGPRTEMYWMVKNYFSVLESHGLVSVQMVQCSILIAAYEIGHGVYPAAYLSPARSARLGQALGIDNRYSAPQMIGRRLGAWAELEELKRVWWAIILLDRFVNLGIRGHMPATEAPTVHNFLPTDDHMWDKGEPSSVEALYVTSSTNVQAGPFARTCQATNLLDKYIRHRIEHSEKTVEHFEEAMQLHRTLSPLSTLLQGEIVQKPLELCTATAICLTTQLHLYDPYSCTEMHNSSRSREESEMQTVAIAGMKSTAAEVMHFSELIHNVMATDLDGISPLIIDCVYQGASTYAWLVHETGQSEMAGNYRGFMTILQTLATRWGAAHEYLKILEQTKLVLYDNNLML